MASHQPSVHGIQLDNVALFAEIGKLCQVPLVGSQGVWRKPALNRRPVDEVGGRIGDGGRVLH